MRKLLPLAALVLAAAASAQSPLTTLFAANNGGATGGAVFFDLQVASAISLAAFDVNVVSGPGAQAALSVHIVPGSYLFNEQNAAFWGAPVSTGAFLTQDLDVPSFVPLEVPVALAPGNYAVALVANGFAHAYTNGNGTAQPGSGTNQTYTTAEVTLRGGSAMNTPFTSTPFQPRMANVSLYYGLGSSGLAAISEKFGSGCYDLPTTFYEDFAPGTFDLGGASGIVNSIVLIPNGTGGYQLVPGTGSWYDGTNNNPGNVPASAPLSVGDDTITQVALPPGFGFFHPGSSAPVNELYVCSNGFVSPSADTDADFSPSSAELLAGAPRWCPAWKDLEPNAQGSVHFDLDPNGSVAYVTFHNVPDWGLAGVSSNTFQIAFFAGGMVEYRWEIMDPQEALTIGYSTGRGAADPGVIDLSAAVQSGYSTGAGAVAPKFDADARPVLGSTINLVTSDLPFGTAMGVNVLSFTRLPGLDLSAVGAPGCQQFVGIDAQILFFPTSDSSSLPLTIPGDSSLVAIEVFGQTAAFAGGQNSLGILFTNALRLRVGDL